MVSSPRFQFQRKRIRDYNTPPIAVDTEITDITGSPKTDVIDLFLIAGSFGIGTRFKPRRHQGRQHQRP